MKNESEKTYQKNLIEQQLKTIKEQESQINSLKQIVEQKTSQMSEIEIQDDNVNSEKEVDIQSTVNMSPNGKYGIIILILDGGARFTYLCDIENEYSYYIESKIPAQTFWSPDSKYFLLDEGTGQSRWGNIYLADTCKKISQLKYRGMIYWLNSTELIFVEENNDIKIDTGTELECTTNIVKYNIKTEEKEVLLEGNSDYYYYINNISQDGSIEISKNYINSESQNEKIEYITITDN